MIWTPFLPCFWKCFDAGGVTKVEDVVRLKELGIAGAIVGRALYEGTIDLAEAIKAGRQTEQ